MKACIFWKLCVCSLLLGSTGMCGEADHLPEEMQKTIHQERYAHAIWGIYAKDLQNGNVLYNLNGEKLFSPASTTKLFSVAALLHAYGDDYRFKTPIYAAGVVDKGVLRGDLILVAQGDLTMGGRQPDADHIDFTKMDHIVANEVPGVILTKENPLEGFNALARQVHQKGIDRIEGDVVIDDSLFEKVEKRGMSLTPIMLNENLIDIVINPSSQGQSAKLAWRPEVAGYSVENQVKTAAKGEALAIEITSDEAGKKIVVKGTIPQDQSNIVRTFSIKDPQAFARAALIQALEQNGVAVKLAAENPAKQTISAYQNPVQVALWTSPPLSEYAKLILKVSHNLGANLVPLLLAVKEGKKTFDEGMLLLGDFATQEVKLLPNEFVFIDGAGGNENRLTPKAEIQLLEYMWKKPREQFKRYYDALPILGVDGSLEDFAKKTAAAGKVRAKPGTGVALNLSTGKLFLITQAYAGYIEGKNSHLYAYIVVVNNGALPAIDDIFAIFEDEGQLSNMIYSHTD